MVSAALGSFISYGSASGHEWKLETGSRHASQEVYPFNVRFAEAADEPGYAARGEGERPAGVEAVPGEDVSGETHPGTEAPSLVELMRMTREEWDAFSRGSAIRRASYAGFKRNVAVALGNWLTSVDEPPADAVAVLREALDDEEPLVREHAAWALGRADRDRLQ